MDDIGGLLMMFLFVFIISAFLILASFVTEIIWGYDIIGVVSHLL